MALRNVSNFNVEELNIYPVVIVTATRMSLIALTVVIQMTYFFVLFLFYSEYRQSIETFQSVDQCAANTN